MTKRRFVPRRRVDANQTPVVEALRAAGYSVLITSSLGNGAPDLMCASRRVTVAMEVKDECQPPSKRLLTADESTWAAAWKGPYAVVLSPAHAVRVMKSYETS